VGNWWRTLDNVVADQHAHQAALGVVHEVTVTDVLFGFATLEFRLVSCSEFRKCVLSADSDTVKRPGRSLIPTVAAMTVASQDKHRALTTCPSLPSCQCSGTRCFPKCSARYSVMKADSAMTSGFSWPGTSMLMTGDFPKGWIFFSSGSASWSLPRLKILRS